MNKRAYIFYLGILLMGIVVAFFVGRKIAMSDPPITETNVKTTKQISSDEQEEGFWLKLEDDRIVVYKQNKKDIVAQTDIKGENCSDRDRLMLEDGIYMENVEKLFKYLQAHTS